MSNKPYKDDRFCEHCQRDTEHMITESGHERDSSSDFYECSVCHWTATGADPDKYYPPDDERDASDEQSIIEDAVREWLSFADLNRFMQQDYTQKLANVLYQAIKLYFPDIEGLEVNGTREHSIMVKYYPHPKDKEIRDFISELTKPKGGNK